MILIDTHVHLYQSQYLNQLLYRAHGNFKNTAKVIARKKHECDGVLCLTQTAKSLTFKQLLDITYSKAEFSDNMGDWRVDITKEKVSLAMHAFSETADPYVVYLIGGQQIVSNEKLEVLSLANQLHISDGMSLQETLYAIAESGGVPIIPWGVGKWFGKRGGVVKRLIKRDPDVRFFLGDNLARPKCWPYVHLFNMARKRGIEILNGSDPLNFTSELIKPGSFGVAFPYAHLDPQRPAAKIKQLLLDRQQPKRNYGTPQSFGSFLASQIKLNFLRLRQETVSRELLK